MIIGRVKLHAYKLQLVQKTSTDQDSRKLSALEMISYNEICLNKIWMANRYSFYLQRSNNPHEVTEHEHDSREVNMWWAVAKNKTLDLFIFLWNYSD